MLGWPAGDDPSAKECGLCDDRAGEAYRISMPRARDIGVGAHGLLPLGMPRRFGVFGVRPP